MSDNSHEVKRTLKEDVYYPTHDPRTVSKIFRKSKKKGKENNSRCMISGSENVEYHHVLCEWAFANAVDWVTMKNIAIGKITTFDVFDPETLQFTGETIPIKDSMVWFICKFMEWRGFDWELFDPSHPAEFIDCLEHLFPLHKRYHREKFHGIHELTAPIWLFQAFPKVDGYIPFPDDEDELKKYGMITEDGFKLSQ